MNNDRKIQEFEYNRMNFELHHVVSGSFEHSTIISLPKPDAAIYIGVIDGLLSSDDAVSYLRGYLHGHRDGIGRVHLNKPMELENAYDKRALSL